MIYCWIMKFVDNRKIKQVRAYLDTDLVTRAIEENKWLEKITVNDEVDGSVWK